VNDWIKKLSDKQKDFKLPDRLIPVIERTILDDKNEPIAYGVVQLTAEAIILTDPDIPIITSAKAMRELMQWAEFGTDKAGISQLHCFVKNTNEKLARTLERKFGFIRTKDIVLVKNL